MSLAAIRAINAKSAASISAGSDVDVIEIDGASNRGIDEIRTLRANVNVKPMRCRYKIYIIDEVHMLTKEAFNALLKTLEEPPANVKFIFCTTDPAKSSRDDSVALPAVRFRHDRHGDDRPAADGNRRRGRSRGRPQGRATGRPPRCRFDARQPVAVRSVAGLWGKNDRSGRRASPAGDGPRRTPGRSGAALLGRERRRVLELFDEALQSGVQISELTDQLLAFFRDLMVLACGASEALFLVGGRRTAPHAPEAVRCGRLANHSGRLCRSWRRPNIA